MFNEYTVEVIDNTTNTFKAKSFAEAEKMYFTEFNRLREYRLRFTNKTTGEVKEKTYFCG